MTPAQLAAVVGRGLRAYSERKTGLYVPNVETIRLVRDERGWLRRAKVSPRYGWVVIGPHDRCSRPLRTNLTTQWGATLSGETRNLRRSGIYCFAWAQVAAGAVSWRAPSGSARRLSGMLPSSSPDSAASSSSKRTRSRPRPPIHSLQ